MKKISIRFRVTFGYTLLMAIVVVITLLMMLFSGHQIIESASKAKLITAVNNSMQGKTKESTFSSSSDAEKNQAEHQEKIEEELANGQLFTNFKTSQDGVALLIYDTDGKILKGTLPDQFEKTVSFKNKTVQEVKGEDGVWYIYDSKRVFTENKTVWIRGIISSESSDTSFDIMLKATFVALPCIVILAALIGFFMTGRAFRPIKKIIETAKQIGDGNDLGKRIGLGEGKDEVYQLANTFDRMFDRLQMSFENEKQFTSDASHELRTPISVIISQCEYALEYSKTPEEYEEALTIVLEQANKMSGLVKQLLTLARSDKGKELMQPELLNISELGQIVAEELSEMAEHKQIRINQDIEKELFITGDELMMMRFFINLVSNAIQYGRTGGTVWISLKKENGTVRGYVRDNGIGIQPEHLEHIWDRFFQADSSRSNEGSGLGLSMVRWIAEAHNGKVYVESQPEKGSTFYFEFPAGEKSIS